MSNFRQIDQGFFAHFGRPIVKDALDFWKRLSTADLSANRVYVMSSRAVLSTNCRVLIQGALITSVIGKAGAGFQARDVSLNRVSVLPQGEDG
jgi:hypothetical protein